MTALLSYAFGVAEVSRIEAMLVAAFLAGHEARYIAEAGHRAREVDR